MELARPADKSVSEKLTSPSQCVKVQSTLSLVYLLYLPPFIFALLSMRSLSLINAVLTSPFWKESTS